MKFSLREVGRKFSIELRNFKVWKMPKLLNFRFSEGRYFFLILTILDKKDLNFSVSEQHRWAVAG